MTRTFAKLLARPAPVPALAPVLSPKATRRGESRVEGAAFFQNDAGQTIVEYALILALLSVALIGSLTIFQSKLGDLFQTLIDALSL
jgi:Flp pilus assembly pilin Flp